jgi:asparagine synthetase B (glutamine-hydrolysing)
MLANLAYFSMPKFQRSMRLHTAKRVYAGRLLELLGPPESEAFSDMRRLLASELRNGLSTLLRYDDRTAGAHGMETRLPFLDYRIVEFANRLPLNLKARHGWTKWILRRYLDRHLPSAVAWRRHKLGFDAPHRSWTDRLIAQRRTQVNGLTFGQGLLRKGVRLEEVAPSRRWEVYNILHLSELMDWQWES